MKKIKLDENFPASFVKFFPSETIDASSVLHQKISGTDDDNLFEICKKENRTIVTFDLDFANILRYPADETQGIIVCRIRKQVSLADIEQITIRVVELVKSAELKGRLYVLDGNKIRMRRPVDDL